MISQIYIRTNSFEFYITLITTYRSRTYISTYKKILIYLQYLKNKKRKKVKQK